MTIFLSPPDVGPTEREMLLAAFDSNWIAPVGPDLTAFEREFAEAVGVASAVAVSSGTAALHLVLTAAGIGPGDVVLVPTFTFAATAFAVSYTGASPVFVDSELSTWNVDPELVEQAIDELDRRGQRPKALLAVDLYGRCADYARLVKVCDREGLLLIEDAAEALGATDDVDGLTRAAGSFGLAGAFSFNGNKIITTSGGGMVVTNDSELAERVRYLSTQARQPVSHYEHTEVGFNYRLSNLLAALGRGQLQGLAGKVERRRAINARYREALGDLPGLSFDPATDGRTCWLTCVTVDPRLSDGVDRSLIEDRLAAAEIESRPLWMPMHRQPVYLGATQFLTDVSDALFDTGLCLPSGSGMLECDLERVIDEVRSCWR
jgi:dTDP-4-amino-4,6-dideoxygalactose transaminase